MTLLTHADENAQLWQAAWETIGLRLQDYKGRQLDRRLTHFRHRHQLASNDDLAAKLRVDVHFRQEFFDYITINVSEFFRNPAQFASLRDLYLPELLQRNGSLRVWSAGCSIGAEIYSVALLLKELAPDEPHTLLATDIDALSLARCRSGMYHAREMKEMEPKLRDRYFRATPDGWQLDDEVRKLVTVRRHDLLKDPFPGDFDLLLCRNVVIYFTDEAKRLLYRRMSASLRPGGLLFIGAAESIFDAAELGLRYLAPCFYKRVAETG